jgi:hypothetical protein
MPNSSSSKYVKKHRHRHRHTKARRHAKKYTLKKVMRGCSSQQTGGATSPILSAGNGTPVPIPAVAGKVGGGTNIINAAIAHQQVARLASLGNAAPYTSLSTPMFGVVGANAQSGGNKSKYRRHRYKKSICRRGRSRRFRGSARH